MSMTVFVKTATLVSLKMRYIFSLYARPMASVKHVKVARASDINFKLLHTGCPIAHGLIK